ncbi:JDVT-CTERM system glutamic-type intramembrane protease MrtJ [Thioalkalivibrio sulfidiphilus]|uniref:JDVT-CTERM system glutamic-type intramembrane protease MrtJ n=1 Tax=Thioalkalivibrio sulfidiphilus TaxID=1033854 RepID=UPI0012DCF653|nr:JDVT-CTERM system glutamic-type intramembrane protease [Thioalkalivibrio sulfidiphilus]
MAAFVPLARDGGALLERTHHLLMLGFVYPVLEEMVFRGLIQGWLAKHLPQRLGPLSLANTLTSVLFTLLHMIRLVPWVAVWVFVPSVIFGFFRERHGSLRTPILLHIYYNLGVLLLFVD